VERGVTCSTIRVILILFQLFIYLKIDLFFYLLQFIFLIIFLMLFNFILLFLFIYLTFFFLKKIGGSTGIGLKVTELLVETGVYCIIASRHMDNVNTAIQQIKKLTNKYFLFLFLFLFLFFIFIFYFNF
jgi:hypothetical protein